MLQQMYKYIHKAVTRFWQGKKKRENMMQQQQIYSWGEGKNKWTGVIKIYGQEWGRQQIGRLRTNSFSHLSPARQKLSYTGHTPVLHHTVVGCTRDALHPLVSWSNLHLLVDRLAIKQKERSNQKLSPFRSSCKSMFCQHANHKWLHAFQYIINNHP